MTPAQPITAVPDVTPTRLQGTKLDSPYAGGSDMTAILSLLAVLGVIAALGAARDRLGERRHRPLAASDADRTRARATIDYHAKVRDSNVQ